MEKGILQRLCMASYAEFDATLKPEKNRAEGLNPLKNCEKGKIFNVSKVNMTLWLEQIQFITSMLLLFLKNVYPVSWSIERRTERWYERRFTFEEQERGERSRFQWNVMYCCKSYYNASV